jgi:urease accessory protein
VITRSVAVVGKGGVLREVLSRPPLTIRRVHSDEPEVCALCLVASAAGPLSGDDVTFELHLEDGARASVTAAGASIAQGGSVGEPARLRALVSVGEEARLHAEPAALIVADGGSVEVTVSLELAASASVLWRELIVLGRCGEPGGSARLAWSVRRDGEPVLVQLVDLTDASLVAWRGMLGSERVIASALVTEPELHATTLVDSPTAVCQQIDDHTALITILDGDAANAERRLSELLTAIDRGAAQPLR